MPLVIDATPGGATANSYEEIAEVDAYFDSRLPLDPPWSAAASKAILLVMGTRLLDTHFSGTKVLVTAAVRGVEAYYKVGRKWTGAAATATQKLAWPRVGMVDANGFAIAEDAIPQDLKDALSEMAGQLGIVDRSLDNDVSVLGIQSVKAGSVAVSFKPGDIFPQVLPQAVIDMIPPSWYTEETVEQVIKFDFAVV